MSVLKRLSCLVLALLTGATLAGCAPGTVPASPDTAPDTGGAFPVSVTHAFGETVVPGAPQRVVTVGVTEQDIVLALGIVPVGVTEWYGDQPHATWPWARDELGAATPEVLTTDDGFDYERIAALRPDLIVGVNAGLDQASFDRLSAIAPTVAQPPGVAYFAPWDAQTILVGTALGRTGSWCPRRSASSHLPTTPRRPPSRWRTSASSTRPRTGGRPVEKYRTVLEAAATYW